MLEVFFFLSMLMSFDSGAIVGQFSMATLTLEECEAIQEEFVETVVPTAEDMNDAYAITTDCIRLIVLDPSGQPI